MTDLKSSLEIAEGFRPGYLGRIAQLHGEYYAEAWGSGPLLEAMMAQELCDFLESYQPNRDLLLTAHADGQLVGSIAIDGSQAAGSGARLRWYILAKEYHGRGIGRTLLQRALNFIHEKGYSSVFLWTVEGLPQSRSLYERAGFRVVERTRDNRYTVEHSVLKMELELSPPG